MQSNMHLLYIALALNLACNFNGLVKNTDQTKTTQASVITHTVTHHINNKTSQAFITQPPISVHKLTVSRLTLHKI